MIEPSLLCSVRQEIRTHLSFTHKETDIYRLRQSGDLANLSGLDSASLAQLPSLLALRDALYSPQFRLWISQVADSGPLSGRKTDMAINVYEPGDHLLCHDDVIGTRRLSYILYLTNPYRPWQPEWGGALRLYPLEMRHRSHLDKDGKINETEVKIPSPEWSKSIPPAFNQLSFFAVQPGESFHDVEEVYQRTEVPDPSDVFEGGRLRIAISGWYHIPQRGEDGYEEGLEERLAEKSSLAQLQGNVDEFDEPQVQWNDYPQENTPPMAETANGSDGFIGDIHEVLSEADLDYLLRFMNPKYLTPDTVEQLEEMFVDESSLSLADFLSGSFIRSLVGYVGAGESTTGNLDRKLQPNLNSEGKLTQTDTTAVDWRLARPPHKHRFLYRKNNPINDDPSGNASPVLLLLNGLFTSRPFRKWLSLATGLKLSRSNLTARRFRRGLDYTLATAYENDDPQLEFTFGMTASKGWEESGDEDDEDEDEAQDGDADLDGSSADEIPAEPIITKKGSSSKSSSKKPEPKAKVDPVTKSLGRIDVGGHEVYMAAEDPSSTADPAQYKSSAQTGGEEDDGILFSAPPDFNHLSVVLRDKGVLKFVKYVSRSAPGDRWDIVGEFEVEDFDGEQGSEEDDEEN